MTHVLPSLASVAAAALLAASLGAPARAQIDPNDTGAGVRLGVESLNNSGQVGDVTLFDSGAETRLVIAMHGTSGRKELARIARGKDCDTIDLAHGFSLAPLAATGVSHTLVHATSARLLSGNYVVVVSTPGARSAQLACGYLHT